jgi:hypothetical protein
MVIHVSRYNDSDVDQQHGVRARQGGIPETLQEFRDKVRGPKRPPPIRINGSDGSALIVQPVTVSNEDTMPLTLTETLGVNITLLTTSRIVTYLRRDISPEAVLHLAEFLLQVRESDRLAASIQAFSDDQSGLAIDVAHMDDTDVALRVVVQERDVEDGVSSFDEIYVPTSRYSVALAARQSVLTHESCAGDFETIIDIWEV